MLAATDPAALARGDVDFVLGELHCASNTLESQFFVAQHPEPERLTAAAAASGMAERILILPKEEWNASRISRATELLLPHYTHLCITADSVVPPHGATVRSALDLVVLRRGDDLVVRHRARSGEYRFLEVAGEPLATLIVDAFRPFHGPGHRPRVTIDRLVVSRAAWTFPAADLSWAFVNDERKRYALARRWRTAQSLPERGFVRVPVERKPMAVDFRSLPMVNLMAKSVRRTAEAGPGQVTLTEMLPDLDRLWLRDAAGARYTAELRLIAVAGD